MQTRAKTGLEVPETDGAIERGPPSEKKKNSGNVSEFGLEIQRKFRFPKSSEPKDIFRTISIRFRNLRRNPAEHLSSPRVTLV